MRFPSTLVFALLGPAFQDEWTVPEDYRSVNGVLIPFAAVERDRPPASDPGYVGRRSDHSVESIP
jgi:hypothetical protein